MARPLNLNPDRLFPSDPATRAIARSLYASIAALPIVSPHGHTDAGWFAEDSAWTDATALLLAPDHYIFRMLYSQGIDLDALAIPRRDGTPATDPRAAWRVFAQNLHLFRGTPSRLWLDHVFAEVFGFEVALGADTADFYFDTIAEKLASPAFRPRALFDRFKIDFLATTEGPQDDLGAHHRIRASGWGGRVVTTYRPDGVIDVEHEQFVSAMARFAELTGEDVHNWKGYLAAHRKRRADFRAVGATATDHGHPTAATANLSPVEAEALFGNIVGGTWTPADAELFRAQMLTEMAAMSVEDGMVMQIHPGAFRNHNAGLFTSHGRDKGADIPTR
ncbi:MAG: glucuronate isomerase, partial [Sphingomonas sp.]